MPILKFLYPNGAKAPTQAQMSARHASAHLEVTLADDDTTVDIVHNLQLDMEKSPEDLQVPIVVVNPISGGENAQPHTLAAKDGNTLVIGKMKKGPGTSLLLDVWIGRHGSSSWLGL